MRRIALVCSFLAGWTLFGGPGSALAQGAQPGPYYPTPAWDQKLACETTGACLRFLVLSNWNNEAVLDRETGLVWQRQPRTTTTFQSHQAAICTANPVGGRYGWRLPTQVELMTLGDPENDRDEFHLAAGHPFIVNVAEGTEFWTIDGDPSGAAGDGIDFRPVRLLDGSIVPGLSTIGGPSELRLRAWCVRGR